MKKILSIVVIVFAFNISMAQETKKTFEKKGDLTEATYYHDNGEIAQHGFFNELGKLEGVWTSYNTDGNKVTTGKYRNGKKIGKWLFWNDDLLKEVEYVDSKIVSVNEWNNKTAIAIRNK